MSVPRALFSAEPRHRMASSAYSEIAFNLQAVRGLYVTPGSILRALKRQRASAKHGDEEAIPSICHRTAIRSLLSI